MLKAVKIKLYPSKAQEIYINKLLGCSRFVYNKCLDEKKNAYSTDKTNLGLKGLNHFFHNDLTKNEEYNFLNEHNTKVFKQSILNLLNAYKRFFNKQSGYPKYKSKHDNKLSCGFPKEAISKTNNYQSNRLTLTSQIKNIKFKTSDKYKNYLTKYKDNIKSATLSKTPSGEYHLSFLVDGHIDKIISKPKNAIVGIDLGIKDFIVTSNGEKYDNIKSISSNQKRLSKLQRIMSKKEKGSNNRKKARIKLAKKYQRINNIKENYLHYIVNQLLNDNQVIVIEDLNVKGMMKNHKLARSIQELSLNQFKTLLKYKAAWCDREVIEIDRWFPSSKLCNCCGYKYSKLSLKERVWTCPNCGTVHNRDENAAVNIRNDGQRILGCRTADVKFVDYPLADDPNNSNVMKLKSNDKTKQKEINKYI